MSLTFPSDTDVKPFPGYNLYVHDPYEQNIEKASNHERISHKMDEKTRVIPVTHLKRECRGKKNSKVK